MKAENQDSLAYAALEFAFSGKRSMSQRQHRQIEAVTKQARVESRESGGKKRSRLWGLGPVWGRFA